MGSLFKSKSEAVIDPGAQEAFNIAKPFHQQALSGMGNLANQVSANPAYDGQRVAGLNQFQTGSANSLGSFAGMSSPYAMNMTNQGMNTLGSASGVGDNYNSIYGRSSMDPTQQIINQAGQYANNPYADGMIDSANRDTYRMLTEQQMPSLARGLSGSGNTNSSRGGVESAIMQRGAADRMNDTASGIRSSLFNTGLNMSQNQYNQNLSNMMQANQGLLGAGQFGSGLMGMGQDYAGNAFNQGQSAGGVDYGYQQRLLDSQQSQFNESIQNPLSVYSALSGAAGNTQAKTAAGINTSPSIASQLAAAGQSAASAYKAFSDIRMKQNINKTGITPAGLSIYEFEYKPEFKDVAGHGRFVGVMAQEAREMFPEAVLLASNGYFAVDYSKIH